MEPRLPTRTAHALLAWMLSIVAPAQDARGLTEDRATFPIAVWLQSPRNAGRYVELGIDLYVGLWKGPTQEQLDALTAAGVHVICAQNEVGLQNLDNPTIVGWMHDDEPDNAQPRAGGGYGPPIEPARIVADYRRMRAADPTRPVLLNLGQGVAWDGWIGRGVRTGHPEDYAGYVKGCDIASFDIYPVTHAKPEVRGRLEFVGHGVRRLRSWAGERPVWACIETTSIHSDSARPTPAQVRAEVWMAITCGARGIVYFAHEFAPRFVEDGLLRHGEIADAVRRVNLEVRALATVIHAPELPDPVRCSAAPEAPLSLSCRRHDGALYVFAVGMSATATDVTFDVGGAGRVEVLGEDRDIELVDGRFTDAFDGYAAHVYRIAQRLPVEP